MGTALRRRDEGGPAPAQCRGAGGPAAAGPAPAGGPAVAVALRGGGAARTAALVRLAGHALAGPAAYLLLSAVQNNVASPVAYGRTLRLNPVAILVSVLLWGML